MTMTSRRIAGAGLALAVLLSGCGQDDSIFAAGRVARPFAGCHPIPRVVEFAACFSYGVCASIPRLHAIRCTAKRGSEPTDPNSGAD